MPRPARCGPGDDSRRYFDGDQHAHSSRAGQRLIAHGLRRISRRSHLSVFSALRGMLRRERVASALLFTGPRGIGKYTLARMFAQAANCERLKDDFCGECATCVRMPGWPIPCGKVGLAERGESADAAAVERTPLILETHRTWFCQYSASCARRSPGPNKSSGAAARGAARSVFQAAGTAKDFHPRRRRYALDRCGPVSQDSGGAAEWAADAHLACGHTWTSCRRSARAA